MNNTREMLVDDRGRYKTLSLFLEIAYDRDAIFTLKDYDHEYNGKTYISLKRLFLEASDPTEYTFATKYLAGWDHWQKICNNQVLAKHIEKWRFELELKLRSEAVRIISGQSRKGSVTAAKWLAERGWDDRPAGRPSKSEIEKQTKIIQDVQNEFEQDYARLRVIGGN